ncbi:cupredoxin domain-containing protein [Microbacterium soli]|uniref:EfeO-type cupredoxin-like domain-containing protein n=1 Tax=Microbacterium soli TaxID=446075 RepID=A0ABP7N4S4_9MICO
MPLTRRSLLTRSALATGIGLLALTGCSPAADVPATGETTEVTVHVEGMRFVPDVIEVPVGNALVVTFENTGDVVHDLVFDGGAGSDHLSPGDSQVIEVGVIGSDLDGWCSVSNHRAMGMELSVKAVE